MRFRSAAALLLATACSRSLEVPVPELGSVTNQLTPAFQPAVVCNAQGDAQAGWPIDLSGNHFVALPRGTLVDPSGVDLPSVSLDLSGAASQMPRNRTYFVDHQRLTVELPTADTASYPLKLAPGSYAVSVTNPGGAQVTKADGLRVVNAPSLTSVREQSGAARLDPVVCADADQTLVLAGSDFRTDVQLAISIGGKALGTATASSATSLTVLVPANTFAAAEASAAGTPYTVKIASPEGCVAPYGSAARVFGVTDVRVASKPSIAQIQAQGPAGFGAPTICAAAGQATLIITGASLWSISDQTAGRLPAVEIAAGASILFADQVALAPAVAGGTFSGTTLTAHFTFTTLPIGPATLRITNANGCAAEAAASFNVQVSACPTLGALALTPRFGWDQQNQPVTLSNQFSQPTTQPFSGGAPLAFLLAPVKGQTGTQRIPLRRVAFLDASTITAVVPTCSGLATTLSNADCSAGIVAGGPYDLEVIDPSGAAGRIAAAFTVVANQPPALATGTSALNPSSITTTGAAKVTVSGTHFDTPGAVRSKVLLGTQVAGGVEFCELAAASGGTTSDTVLDVAVPASLSTNCYVEDALGTRTPTGTGFLLNTGLYLVRAQHTGDVAFADYSGLIVVATNFNPVEKGTASSTLNTARGSEGVVVATEDFGNAFLYAVGGSTDGADALASVEVAPIGLFGDLGGSCTGATCKFRVLDRTPLPLARAGLALVARTVPNDTTYLFAIGGRSGTTAATEVRRAQVLRNADAPSVTSATATAGALTGGAYYYRVSAIRPASDVKNPGGETLASDTQPITLATAGGATVNWKCSTAQKYRIYRTANANAPAGTEVLIAEQTATPSCSGVEQFTDNGSTAPGTESPLPLGAIGKWAGAGEGVPQLGGARFDTAARIVGNTIYVVGGCSVGAASAGAGSPVVCTAGNELADLERATFATGGDITPGAFTGAGTAVLANKRSRLALAVADASRVVDIPAGKTYLVAVGGRVNNADITGNTKTVEVADLSATNPTFTQPASMPTTAGSGGWAEVIANLFFFELDSGGSALAKSASPGPICAATACNSAGTIDFKVNSGFPTYQVGGSRYLAGEHLFRAFIYVVGGFASSSTFTPTNTVERIVY